ncbi:MAG: DUF3791 domain-containing protein [Alistipes sp.]|nr:DUF3791 domain-containing protein [Alistipes sp.]
MMLPFKVQRLLSTIIEKKGLDIEDALGYLYSSDTYRQLSSDSPYLRRLSTANLYDMLKKGKRKKKQTRNISSDTLLFISSCIENYKEHKRMGADEVLMLFKKYDVTDYLIQGFEVLHTQGKKYIMADIDRYIKNRE